MASVLASAQTATILQQANFHTTPGIYTGFVPGTPRQNVLLEKPSGCYRDADQLAGIATSHLVPSDVAQIRCGYSTGDWVNVTGPALRMATGGVSIPLRFENLAPGVYFVRLVGRVAASPVPRIREPLYLHLRINDGPKGETNEYRVRILYANTLEETGRIFFHALNLNNTLDAELFVGPGSRQELLLHRLEFYDALAGTDRQIHKTSPGTFTLAERDAARRLTAEIGTKDKYAADPNGTIYADNHLWRWINQNSPFLPTNLTSTARINRDDQLWLAFPPLNSMHLGSGTDGGLFNPPAGTNGTWDVHPIAAYSYQFAQTYATELILTNTTLGASYSWQDLVAHRPLPGMFGDDGLGWWVPGAGASWSSPGSYYFIISRLLHKKVYEQFYQVLSGEQAGDAHRLPLRYHLTGNPTAAHDAAVLLARLALQWPALQMEVQEASLNAANPDLNYNADWRWEARRLGKIVYEGWSSEMLIRLLTAYDQLFDFIYGNHDFAAALHRYIPWIQTPDDVVRFFDNYLVQVGIQDTKTRRITGTEPMLLGLIHGPGGLGTELMDISQAQGVIHPLGQNTLKRHYHNSFSQDGSMFIGSTMYMMGQSALFLNAADSIRRFKATGGSIPFDLTGLEDYPKIPAFSELLLNSTVAGGYSLTIGDASHTTYSRRQFFAGVSGDSARKVWQLSGHPQAAWLLKNVFGGRTSESDEEWAQLDYAASQVSDPRLTSRSRVFAGFGAGILESGTEHADYRKKRAVFLRAGTGQGHAHNDALDLNFFALGLRMANDFGQRNEGSAMFTVPPDSASYTHNTVEVDGLKHHSKLQDDWPGGSFSAADAWFEIFQTNRQVQLLSAAGLSLDHKNVDLFRRDVALIDVGEANSYVFDVFRVRGGKWHTWCFHGADSGAEEGGFTVNTTLATPQAGSLSESYLRKHATTTTREGTAPAKLEATWRLSRTATTSAVNNRDGIAQTVTTVAAEPAMLGADYDPLSPRKYTKVTLFGREGDTVMSGNLYSSYYKLNMPLLYVQSRQPVASYSAMAEKQNVFPSLIEAFAGDQPLILDSALLPIANNESDALAAVALRVALPGARTDLVFSDGRNLRRTIDGGTLIAQGRFALYSEEGGAFRTLNLVGGRELTRGSFSVKPAIDVFRATIQSVDYEARTLRTVERLPSFLVGRQFHLYNADHHCSYRIDMIEDEGSGSRLHFANPADIGWFTVKSLSDDTIVSDDRLALDYYANRHRGLTAVNETRTKTWKIEKTSSLQATASINYRLSGATVAPSDLTDADGDGVSSVYVYDFGPGDTLECPSNVWCASEDAGFAMISDSDLSLTLPGRGRIQIRIADESWQDLPSTSTETTVTAVIPADLFAGAVRHLRITQAKPAAPTNVRVTMAP